MHEKKGGRVSSLTRRPSLVSKPRANNGWAFRAFFGFFRRAYASLICAATQRAGRGARGLRRQGSRELATPVAPAAPCAQRETRRPTQRGKRTGRPAQPAYAGAASHGQVRRVRRSAVCMCTNLILLWDRRERGVAVVFAAIHVHKPCHHKTASRVNFLPQQTRRQRAAGATL